MAITGATAGGYKLVVKTGATAEGLDGGGYTRGYIRGIKGDSLTGAIAGGWKAVAITGASSRGL